MMRWIVGSSLRLRFLVLGAAAALLVFGAVRLRDMPVDTLPEFAPPTVEVQTEALGLSATEVEQLITVPMEQDLLIGVAWLDEIRSESVQGLSRIQLIFEPGTDLHRARQVVQERLTQAHALPNVSKPPQMLQPLSSTSRVMMVRLSSAELSPIEMSVLSRWTVKPRLMGVDGVANVSIWGNRERQLQVQVDPAQLQAQGVTLADVIRTTGNALWVSPLTFLEASTPGVGGFIDTPNQRIGIQHLLPIKTPEELSQVVIEGDEGQTLSANGQPLRLGDVSTVVEDHQPLIGDAIAGEGEGSLLLVIEKFPEANTLEVTRDVESALASLGPGLTGVEIDSTVFRPATFIEEGIDNLFVALLIGLALATVVIGLFRGDWRGTLICVVAIPVSFVAAVVVLYLRGATFNTMILAGLAVALVAVVDDAVITVDNIARRLRQNRQSGGNLSPAAVIVEATLEVRGPMVAATLILLLAAVPVFFVGFWWGLSGAFFRPLAWSYTLALAASMVVALTVTPALALALLARAPVERRGSPVARWVQDRYDSLLPRIVGRPRWIYVAAAVVVIVGVALTPLLKQSMQPAPEDRDLLVRWEGAPGTSEPEMSRITTLASTELKALPGVRNVAAHVGRAITSDMAANVNAGEIWVSVDPGADYDATVASIREVVDGYPGLEREVITYPEQRIREVLTGSPDDLVVRVFGQDLATLNAKAEEVRQLVAGIDGVVDPRVLTEALEPTIEVQVDLAKAEQYGLKPGDVRRAAATLLGGVEVGNLFEDQKVFEVVVWGAPQTRHSLTSVQELPIDTPSGGQVRLGEVAAVRLAPNPPVINHDAVSRFVDVTADVSGRSVAEVSSEVEQQLQGFAFPIEFHAEVLGDYAERRSDVQRWLGFAIAAALGIYLLLQATFGSWRLATVAFLVLLASLVGGVPGVLADGRVVSLGALAGFLAILGMAARSTVMLISHYQRLEREEGGAIGPHIAERGARERVVPILTTALATGLALVPLAVAGSSFGQEIVRPMVFVLFGGLVTSTLLVLFVVPSLYLRFAPRPQPATAPERVSMSPAAGSAAD